MAKPKDLKKHAFMFTDDIKFLQKAVVFAPYSRKFLALKRTAESFSRPNDWDFAGGNVLYGTLHEESLRNEVKEEAGLEVGKLTPAQVVTNYDKEKGVYHIFNGFYCKATSDDVKLSDEHSEHNWVTKDEFIRLEPAEFLLSLVNDVFEKL